MMARIKRLMFAPKNGNRVKALAAGGMAALTMTLVLAFPSRTADAQEPDLVLSPTSGPCDGAIDVRGEGFPANKRVAISILRPHSEGPYARLGEVPTDAGGGFAVGVTLGAAGCEVAARDDAVDDPGEPKELFIWSNAAGASVAKVARYTYTTTSIEGATVAPPVSPTATEVPSSSPSSPVLPATAVAAASGDGSDSNGTAIAIIVVAISSGALVVGAVAYVLRRGSRGA